MFLLNFVLLQASIQTITAAESIPHKDGLIETLEKSLLTADGEAPELQEFIESIAKLIQQVPVIRREIDAIRVTDEEQKATEKAVSAGTLALPVNGREVRAPSIICCFLCLSHYALAPEVLRFAERTTVY